MLISDSAINQEDFMGFVKDLQRKNYKVKLALYMDNLVVHKTNNLKDLYTKLNIKALYNIPYSPDTNPIEACFSVVKSHFKRSRLGCLVNGRPFNFPPHMKTCIKKITPQLVENCERHSMRILNDINFLKWNGLSHRSNLI